MTKYVIILLSVVCCLSSSATAKADPPGQDQAKRVMTQESSDARYLKKDEVCEAVKQCKEETAKTPSIRWLPHLIGSGNVDLAESKRTDTIVCMPGSYPFVLDYGWQVSTRYGGPNVRYFKRFIRCDVSATEVAKRLSILESQVVTTKSLEEILKKQKEIDAKQDATLADHEGRITKSQTTADEALTVANSRATQEDLAKKADKSELNRIRFVPGVGVAYMGLPGSNLFLGVVDVGIGGMWNDKHGISAGGRFMFSPGGFNSNTYPNGKSGQVWGGGAYLHFDSVLSESKDDDGARKRVILGVGPTCMQVMRVHGSKHFQAITCGAEVAVNIPLGPHVSLTPMVAGGYAVANQQGREKPGPFVIVGLSLSGTF